MVRAGQFGLLSCGGEGEGGMVLLEMYSNCISPRSFLLFSSLRVFSYLPWLFGSEKPRGAAWDAWQKRVDFDHLFPFLASALQLWAGLRWGWDVSERRKDV